MNSITPVAQRHLRPGGSGSCGRGHGHGLRMRVGSSSIGGHGDKPPEIRIWHSPLPALWAGQDTIEGATCDDTGENARQAALDLRPRRSPSTGFARRFSKADALNFMDMFPGKTAYAVKTNGEPMVLKALAEAGVTCFDVASPQEIADVRAVAPQARDALNMHPVKAQSHIRLALEDYGIRVIAIDHEDEITKLTRVRQGARHRSGAPSRSSCASRPMGSAAYELSEEVRVPSPAAAVELADKLGPGRLPGGPVLPMSAARSRIPTPMSARWPPPTGCANRNDARSLPRSMSAAAFPG